MLEIVGSGDIAGRLNVAKPTVRYWMRLRTFPKPLATVNKRTPVWDWAQIETWHANRGDGRVTRHQKK